MLKKEKVFSCFGHRNVEITDELVIRVGHAIERAIGNSFRIFLFGGLSDFEDIVYEIVSQKAKNFPNFNIKRVFCFPCENDLRKPPHWFEKREYEEYCCPPKDFNGWYKSIYYRNCSMIDQSDFVLFYANEDPNSGAYKAYKYALKKHKKNVNFALKPFPYYDYKKNKILDRIKRALQ